LLLLIAVPTLAAVALGGVNIASSWQKATADQRPETLAGLSTKVTQLAFQIEAERDAIVWYIAAGSDGRASQLDRHANPAQKQVSKAQLQIVQQQFTYTAASAKAVATGVARFGSGYPSAVQIVARAVTVKLRTLPILRHLALATQVSATTVLADYGNLVDTLLAFDDQIPLKSIDPQLISTTRAMATISRYENEAAVQRAIVMYRLTAGTMSPAMLTELTTSVTDQKADATDFQNFATNSQAAMFSNALAASLENRFQSDELTVIQTGQRSGGLAIVPQDWYGAASDVIAATHKYEETLAQSAVDRARALHSQAITSALVIGGILLLVIVFSLILAMFIGRSMPPPRPVTALALS